MQKRLAAFGTRVETTLVDWI